MATVRRCLGCSATSPADAHVCPKCGSAAAELVEQAEPKPKAAEAKPKPARRRKT